MKESTVDLGLQAPDSGHLKNAGVGESMGKSTEVLGIDGEGGKEGDPQGDGSKQGTGRNLSFSVTAFFMVAQMAGAGFLSLPRAVANAGWGGAVMIVVFCVSIGFAAVRLGRCWVILEERWPKCYKEESVRQPYMEIAYRSLGIHGRRIALLSVLITLTGSTTIFNILISEMMSRQVPAVSQCEWSLITAAILLPTVWLGSPKDFWQASVLAVVSTVVAVVVIVSKMIIDREKFLNANPVHLAPTISSFSLGFGAILFSYGGAAVFPTIQNDMKNRADFWKSVIMSFLTILLMYFPVGVVGYILIGDAVESNILLSLGPSTVVTVAIALQIINLMGTFVIAINPVVQSIEDIIGIPKTFGWQRVVVRSSFVVFELMIAFTIPNFALILNLVGGSTMSCLAFILPPLMYMRLVDDKSDSSWPERNIALWERVYLWAISIVGIIGGISATVSAVMAIMQPSSIQESCFMNFYGLQT